MANQDIIAASTWLVLGALIKLRFTQPEETPCTADFLTAACNQVTEQPQARHIDKAEVHQALATLVRWGLVQVLETAGTFRYGELSASRFQLSPSQQALFAVLLLNEPLTASELLKSSYRLYPFRDEAHIIATIGELADKRDKPLARHWPPNTAGEARFTHTRYQQDTPGYTQQTPTLHPAEELDQKVAELSRIIDHLVPPHHGK
jgi:uncharacterized protein YceH (UPF0502 family)